MFINNVDYHPPICQCGFGLLQKYPGTGPQILNSCLSQDKGGTALHGMFIRAHRYSAHIFQDFKGNSDDQESKRRSTWSQCRSLGSTIDSDLFDNQTLEKSPSTI